jgi:hypothetical protein
MNIDNYSQNVLGQDSLHEESNCGMEALVDLVAKNVV